MENENNVQIKYLKNMESYVSILQQNEYQKNGLRQKIENTKNKIYFIIYIFIYLKYFFR